MISDRQIAISKKSVVVPKNDLTAVSTTEITQQQVTVRGKVIEAETGEPLPGVSVLVDKSPRGVITDLDGTFEIKVSPSDKLVFSFIGMETQTVVVGNKTAFDIVMAPAISELEEFEVVAFGKQKKESMILL